MYLEGRNWAFHAGRSLIMGPHSYEIALAWNNISLLSGNPPIEFDRKAADWITLSWEWPRFRGVRLWTDCLPWNDARLRARTATVTPPDS